MIENGHSFTEIGNYTIRQFQEFIKVIGKLKKSDLLIQLALNATAAQGDEAGIKKMQQLLGGKVKNQIPDKWITK